MFIALLAGLTLVSMSAQAQPKAIGGRFGWVTEVSYQHTLGPGFLEAGLGVTGFGHTYEWHTYGTGLALDATYNWVVWTNTASKENKWEFFLGGGLGMHTLFGRYYYWTKVYSDVVYTRATKTYVPEPSATKIYVTETYVGIGVLGHIGIQYQFPIPLQLAVSWRPMLGGVFGVNHGAREFYTPGLYDGAVSVRYVF